MNYLDLHRRLHDFPFTPFRIRLVNNTVIDVHEPGLVIVGETSAVVATQTELDDKGVRVATDWKTLSIAHMLEFADIRQKNGQSRRKK
jgi:hypothetical protein